MNPADLRSPRLASLALLACLIAPWSVARAQVAPLSITWSTGEQDPPEALLSLDSDDDDDDGVPDLAEAASLDASRDNEVARVVVRGASTGAVRVTVEGGARVLTAAGLVREATVPVTNGRAEVALVGVAASATARDAAVTFTAGAATRRVELTVAAVSALDGANTLLRPHRDAVGPSHEITTSETLPRAATWGEASTDPDNVRVEVWDPGSASVGRARVESLGTPASIALEANALRGQLSDLSLARPATGVPLRSRFVRLVGDDLDLRAPGVQGQTLLVGLRDRLRVRYQRPGVAGEATTDIGVGRPGNEDGPLAARRARWHIIVLRQRGDRTGPVVGNDDAGAMRIARRQVEISNEIYVQCAMTWGDPARADVSIVEPPHDALLSVSDNDGFSAAGGVIRVQVNGTAVGPVRQVPGWRPVETARALAAAIRARGFSVRVSENPRTDYGAWGSADLIARDRQGRLATFSPVAGAALSTDARQSVTVGRVDLADGIDEFNNLNSASGTLEERSLVKPLADDDPSSIELFVINRFARGTRIGEAFVEGAAGAIVNGLLIDRAGISAEREAWTQSHEAGHILLDQPWHPDNMGPDRPWLLMDADASLAAVTGPKRLTAEECARIHQQSGVDAVPSILSRYDVAHPSPRAVEFVAWPREALYPRDAPPSASGATPNTRSASAQRAADPTAAEVGVTLRE